MSREAWGLYVAELPDELRSLAQRLMNRIEQLINRDRIDLLDAIRRSEGRLTMQSDRIGDVDDRLRRALADQDRIEERLEFVEQQCRGLVQSVADLHARAAKEQADG